MVYERVYAVWEYYDGVQAGVANYRGRPHYFERKWSDEADDVLAPFTLKPLDDATLDVVLEQWQILRAWEVSFHRGERRERTHPGLPGQDSHYEELEQIARAKIAAVENTVCALGKFEALPQQEHLPRGVMREMHVAWSEAEPLQPGA